MQEPTYKPNQWIRYSLNEDTAGFGQIIGGIYFEGGWKYLLNTANDDNTNVHVPEETITHYLEGVSWSTPSHFSGGGSAYASVEG